MVCRRSSLSVQCVMLYYCGCAILLLHLSMLVVLAAPSSSTGSSSPQLQPHQSGEEGGVKERRGSEGSSTDGTTSDDPALECSNDLCLEEGELLRLFDAFDQDKERETVKLHPEDKRDNESEEDYNKRVERIKLLKAAISHGIHAAIEAALGGYGVDNIDQKKGEFSYCQKKDTLMDVSTGTEFHNKEFTLTAHQLPIYHQLWPHLHLRHWRLNREEVEEKGAQEIEKLKEEFVKKLNLEMQDSFDPQHQMELLPNPGSSKAMLFVTANRRFLVKSGMKPTEMDKLKQMLTPKTKKSAGKEGSAAAVQSYQDYIKCRVGGGGNRQRPLILLPFYGHFTFKTADGETENLLLMENRRPRSRCMKFDMKLCRSKRCVLDMPAGIAGQPQKIEKEHTKSILNSLSSPSSPATFLTRGLGLLSSPLSPSRAAREPREEPKKPVNIEVEVKDFRPPSPPPSVSEGEEHGVKQPEQQQQHDHSHDETPPSTPPSTSPSTSPSTPPSTKTRKREFVLTYKFEPHVEILPRDFMGNERLNTTYRDANFKARLPGGISLRPLDYERLITAIGSDVNMLIKWGGSDYSIFLIVNELENGEVHEPLGPHEFYGVLDSRQLNDAQQAWVQEGDTPLGVGEPKLVIVSVAIIDYLGGGYGFFPTIKTWIEYLGKKVWARLIDEASADAAVMPPPLYANRMKRGIPHIFRRMQGDLRLEIRREKSAGHHISASQHIHQDAKHAGDGDNDHDSGYGEIVDDAGAGGKSIQLVHSTLATTSLIRAKLSMKETNEVHEEAMERAVAKHDEKLSTHKTNDAILLNQEYFIECDLKPFDLARCSHKVSIDQVLTEMAASEHAVSDEERL